MNIRQWYRGRERAKPFVFTINTANTSAGSTTNTQFKLPLDSAGTYDFVVDWGDSFSDTITVWNAAATTHTYSSTGTYTVTIKGVCTGWRFANTGDRLKILDIQNWGVLRFLTHNSFATGYFTGCANLQVTATDKIDFTGCIRISGMFHLCTLFTGNASFDNWDLSNMTAIDFMFANTRFNHPVNSWNLSSCTNIQAVFENNTFFNQPVNNWNVSNVVTFTSVFRSATSFNQSVSNWNTISGTNMNSMFRVSTAFNQNIGHFDCRNVTDFGNFMLGKTNLNYSAANLDAIYNGWTDRPLQASRTITFASIKYTAAGTQGRALLTRTNTTVSISNAVNNGSGLIRITSAAHGRTTGEKIFISGVVGTTEANGGWIVTVIDATTLDLQGSTFTNTYTSGGTLRTGYGWSITDGGI
jgi:hypothetical protein